MSWMQKLCEVYDRVIDMPVGQGQKPLLPVGFTFKKIKYQVTLSSKGEFLAARILPKEEQESAVPTTPQAEARTGASGAPFPLAEQCKYLFCIDEKENLLFDSYMRQLEDWSNSEYAPQCLKILTAYLRKHTLYQDIINSGVELKFHRDDTKKDGDGPDAKSILCFAVNNADGEPSETRLWKREDVRSSWLKYLMELKQSGEPGLCYVTGEKLPITNNHPKVQGNAKLISAKDGDFQFRYRGRFTDEKQVTSVSSLASTKAHNALHWLVERQGTKKFGLTAVAWNVEGEIIRMAGCDEDEYEQEADTFIGYGAAVRDAVNGKGDNYMRYHLEAPEVTQERMNDVCILCMESANEGRMSVTYYQEIQGNDFTKRLNDWYTSCKWPGPIKGQPDKAPTITQIGKAVFGSNTVAVAFSDDACKKADTKLMRELKQRIIMCIVEGVAIPEPYVRQAFNRSIAPLSFTKVSDKWDKQQWLECMATTCALIRKSCLDRGISKEQVSPELQVSLTNRSYLYGRLVALADVIEKQAHKDKQSGSDNQSTNALRMMKQLVQRPYETWAKLHDKLLPYIMSLQEERYQRQIGEIEALFMEKERSEHGGLSEMFLLGFYTQQQAMYKQVECTNNQGLYKPYLQRDELFGCLLAIADVAEQKADPERVGRTNAVTMSPMFACKPNDTWAVLHNKLLPYLERLGQKQTCYFRNYIRKIESCFDEFERISQAPLGALYLHGYYCMRNALLYGKVGEITVQDKRTVGVNRESLYGQLLAEEDRTERIVLGFVQHTEDEDNRPSNALRFLARSAERPEEVWQYLRKRMYPYARKMRFSHALERVDKLHMKLHENGWDTDEPLNSSYLHYFYVSNHEEE